MTIMKEENAVQKRLKMELQEDRFIERFHQNVKKTQQKSWHDKNIKMKEFQHENLVLLYDSKFLKHPGKFQMHWL